MPFAPQIRKTILEALDRHIIPAVEGKEVMQILAAPPFDFSHVEHWTHQKSYLPHKKLTANNVKCHWEKEQIENSSIACIAFLYEGVADDKIGITTRMAKELKDAGFTVPSGITVLRLRAPTVIYYPPGVPHRSGGGPYCEKKRPGFAASRMIWVVFLPDELLVHYCESEIDSIFSSHSLQVKDRQLAHLAEVYMEETQHVRTEDDAITKSLLLALMKRLRRHLARFPVPLSNSAYPDISHMAPKATQFVSGQLCERAIQYIDLHLQDALTWKILAGQFAVSPNYMNHVFRKFTGMPVMRYVTSRRIEAAQQMLIDRLERISDIAQLTGFASSESFSNSFKRHVGCTPSEFRHRTDRNVSTKSTFEGILSK